MDRSDELALSFMAILMRKAVLGARDAMNETVQPYLYDGKGKDAELAHYKLLQAKAMELVANEMLEGARVQREVYEKAKKK